MADHLTPEQLARIDATVARVRAERADAGIMSAKYDAVCERMSELHDESVRLRRRAEALEDQLADRDAELARVQALADRRWAAYQSARRRARQQRDALREALAADRDQVRRVRDRYRDERDTAREHIAAQSEVFRAVWDQLLREDAYAKSLEQENAALRAQLAATTNPDRAVRRLEADAHPTSTCGCGHPHVAHWGESASGRTECMTVGCPCGGADVPRGPRSPNAIADRLAADAHPEPRSEP